jgi:hypothetical protein
VAASAAEAFRRVRRVSIVVSIVAFVGAHL